MLNRDPWVAGVDRRIALTGIRVMTCIRDRATCICVRSATSAGVVGFGLGIARATTHE
jgi:hypothetical protein